MALIFNFRIMSEIIYGVFSPSSPHTAVVRDKLLFKRASLPRLTASRFPPASKLAGIQRSSL